MTVPVPLAAPSNESGRLAALRRLEILDTPAEQVYDDVVNDTHGQAAGDELLRIVARLALASRETDTVARYAGDEFVIVCPDMQKPANLGPIVERARAAVGQPASVLGVPLTPRISLGWAVATDEDDVASLIARADAAMYEIKRVTS